MYSVILLVAGTGSRMGLGYNKALYQISGKTIVEHSIQVFLEDENCGQIVMVTSNADLDQMQALFKREEKVEIVLGGKMRQDSVCEGLKYVKEDVVLVHDGARPFVTREMVNQCYLTAKSGIAGLLAIPVKDTIKKVRLADTPLVASTLDRSELVAAQTPQFAPTPILRMAHACAKAEGFVGTDDVHLIERYTDMKVKVLPGSPMNVKFTTPEDIVFFEYVLSKSNDFGN